MSGRLIVTLVLILFLTPQTGITYHNYVVEFLHSTGIFYNYIDVKRFVYRSTWLCIFLYIALNLLVVL